MLIEIGAFLACGAAGAMAGRSHGNWLAALAVCIAYAAGRIGGLYAGLRARQ